jgi:two-component system cell cycle sensor histidine kinase/response regulator CckA
MKGKSILVVEDEDTVRRVICRLLSSAGFTVHSADSPRTALAHSMKYKRLDLLIADVILPGMDGKSLADILSEDNPGMKVLFISGYPEEAFARSGILPAEANFLQKPFASVSLEEMICRMLAEETLVLADSEPIQKGAHT